MAFTSFEFKRKWTNPDDFPTIEHDEAKVRSDMQALHDEVKGGLNGLMAELERSTSAANLGAMDTEGNPSKVQIVLDALAKQLSDHVDVDPGNLTAQNIGLLRELAVRYGLADKAIPTVHDALEAIGELAEAKEDLVKLAPTTQYLDHWWVRRRALSVEEDTAFVDPVHIPDDYIVAQLAFATSVYNKGYPNVVFEYADAIGVTEEGVHFVAQESHTIECRPENFLNEVTKDMLRGRYVRLINGPFKGRIFLVGEDAEILMDGGPDPENPSIASTYYFSASEMQEVYFERPNRPWERIHDADRNAYPDSGELDGMEYRYMGVPVERLIDMMVEEATTE